MPKDIFELELLTFYRDMDFKNPYPAFKISRSGCCLCRTFEEANIQIKKLAANKGQEKIYRFVLRQLPLAERLHAGDFLKLWVYNANGQLLDLSLCSDCASAGAQNEFRGRPENLIHFRKGEIVEWFDRAKARLAVVTGLPLTPSQCLEIAERHNNRHPEYPREWILDWSDDSYTVIHGPDYAVTHEHIFAPFVSKPAFEVPEELRKYLEEAWEKVKDEK